MDEATREEVTRLLRRGLNHYGLGDLEAAIGCWERAKELDPRNRAARDYLETAYEESGLRGEKAGFQPLEEDDTPRTSDGGIAFADPESGLPLSDDTAPDTRLADALGVYKSGNLDEAWDRLRTLAANEPDRLDIQGYLLMVRSERARQWARDIGDQGRALRRARTTQELMGLNLSPDEGFLLSQIDGNLSIEQLLNLSSDRVRTLEIIAKFLKEGLAE